MNIYTETIEKLDIKALASFLLYNSGAGDIEALDHVNEKIEASYTVLFDNLEEMFPEADRDNDRLFNTVTDFVKLHDEIYFQAGLILGFQLFKTLEQSYSSLDENFVRSIMEKL